MRAGVIRAYWKSPKERERHEEGMQCHQMGVLLSHIWVFKVMGAVRGWCRLVPLENERLVDVYERFVHGMRVLFVSRVK